MFLTWSKFWISSRVKTCCFISSSRSWCINETRWSIFKGMLKVWQQAEKVSQQYFWRIYALCFTALLAKDCRCTKETNTLNKHRESLIMPNLIRGHSAGQENIKIKLMLCWRLQKSITVKKWDCNLQSSMQETKFCLFCSQLAFNVSCAQIQKLSVTTYLPSR